MNKNISEEKLVQHFSEIAEFELPKEAVQRDIEDIRKLLSDQEKDKSSAGKNVWRMIMQDKTTRYISAATIIFAVFIAMQFLPESQLNAAQLLTKVSQNMRKFTIVKSVTENYFPGQTEPVDFETHIVDYNRKQAFIVYSKGYLHQLDYEKMIWSVYRPEDNTMVVQPLSGEWPGPDEQVDEYIKKLSQEGLEIHQSELLEDGVKLTVIEYNEILNNISVDPNKYMSNTMINNTIVKRIHTKLWVNRNELYLSRAELSYYDVQDNLILTKKSTSEPAESAPVDIYELGVPADVTIINKVPDERVKEIKSQINDHKSGFLKNYMAIQLENIVETDGTESMIEGMVIYSQGKKLRVDVYRRQLSQNIDKGISTDVGTLLNYSIARLSPYVSQKICPRAIRIYDGLLAHKLVEDEGELVLRTPLRRPEGDEYGDDDIDDFGWRVLWMMGEPERMYEDDFSKENDLLGMEVTSQSQFGQLPERKVLYIDSAKDYCFRRYIEEKRADAPWQKDENWLESVEDKWNIVETTNITDVTEYAQTSDGQWYPKTMHLKMTTRFPFRENSDKTYEENRIIRIYLLEENPNLPDKLFDTEQLSIPESEEE